MHAFLGLFLFSVLLTTGASLECEVCASAGNSCSGQKETCPGNLDTCITIVAEALGQTATTKSCYSKKACELLKDGENFNGALIKEVTCKAPSASASLLLALSGLLLIKFLF
ncbi:phospholipase A2 inhibitor and Ly6/PLAUR domain-containing protein-like [Paroedura picta]|uniref:phospholipase A2 inhibitor and Ly6/PLAUR domain-containing protein-like n=1 Tax=Paroedura picta TaxID=143630 RepID=UPI004056BA66